MFLFSIIVSGTLFVAALVQLLIAIVFEKGFHRKADLVGPSKVIDFKFAKAGIVLGIRGWDPSLEGCLIGLLDQTWPNLEIQVIIDNRNDYAWRRVHQIKSDFDRQDVMQISELTEPFSSCSLKCSAMIRGIERLGNEVQYIATIDADVTPHPTWLSELITPLMADLEIGLVTGNQWFEPPADGGWGASLRSTWSAGALVLSIYFANPWAGSMAMRRRQVEQLGLIECWRGSAVDDGPLVNAFNCSGLRRHFATSLVMVNRENCSMGYATTWMRRMLTWSRLYEPTFYLSVIHALFSNLVMIAVFYSLFFSLYQQLWLDSLVPLASLIASGMLSVAAYLSTRRVVMKSCQISKRTLDSLPIQRYWRLFWSVPLAQAWYLINCFAALFTRRIQWRGIWYQIQSDKTIVMSEYQPYHPPKNHLQTDSQNSIG